MCGVRGVRGVRGEAGVAGGGDAASSGTRDCHENTLLTPLVDTESLIIENNYNVVYYISASVSCRYLLMLITCPA